MIYNFDLRSIGFFAGIALVVIHLLGILHANSVRAWLKAFPRSKAMGAVFLTVVSLWAFWLISTMDLGEFTKFRTPVLVAIPVFYGLCLKFVDEFLSVRALGILLLLLAEPVLEAAFLRKETSRLLLVCLAYVWIALGIFWVALPYLMRDQVAWLLKSNTRWVAACVAGIVYGVAILVSAALFYQG